MTTQVPRQRRSQAQRSAETRARLLESTIDCLVKYGYSGTTMPRVAEMAGMTRGAQAHHFGSRDELMIAAVQYLAATRAAAAVPTFGDRITSTNDPLDTILDTAWELHSEAMFIPIVELWVAGRTDPALHGEVGKLETIVLTSLLGAVAEYVPEEIHRSMLEFMYMAMDVVRGILISSLVDPDPSRARRRWDRARPGLRRSADASINEWIAARH